jgi:hypothetical protein
MKTACLLVTLLLASASLGVLSGWGAEPPAVVVERELQRFNTAWPTQILTNDPRFGIIRVLSLLKLDFPGLENVKAAEQAKLYDVAELELLDYFKRTRSAKEPVKTLGTQERLHANDAFLTALVPSREGTASNDVEASVKREGDCQRFTLKVGPTTREIRLNLSQKTSLLEYGN